MEILPAIDLRDGKVVRLQRGDYSRQTTYSDDPGAVALAFAQAGVRWIHVVDLDAALTGKPANLQAVRAVRQAAPKAMIELGGGARNDDNVRQMLDCGIDRVVIGSAALKDWPWFEQLVRRGDMSGRIALGLDARDGKLAVHGWTQQLDLTPAQVAMKVRGWPLGAVIFTDIGRDAMLQGVNVDATAEVVAAADVPVIASGGVAGIDDVRACRKIGCGGLIIGKAYYEGRVDLAAALSAAK